MSTTTTHPARLTAQEAHDLFRRRSTPLPSQRVVEYLDPWRGHVRRVRFTGACVACQRPTWAADDGENDPRGVLGDLALCEVELDHPRAGVVPVRACFGCQDNEPSYRYVLRVAELALNTRGEDVARTVRALAARPALLTGEEARA